MDGMLAGMGSRKLAKWQAYYRLKEILRREDEQAAKAVDAVESRVKGRASR